MAEYSICSNCGNRLKEQWLVCKHCHQARWKRILPYYFGGISFFTIALLGLTNGENSFFQCFGALMGFLGALMLLIGGIATLQGLTVKKQQSSTSDKKSPPVNATRQSPENHSTPEGYVRPPMVDRLGEFSYTKTDEDRIKKILYNIQLANKEPKWKDLGLQKGHVERGNIPEYTRETIDYLLDGHIPTRNATLAKLFKEGDSQLRETIIRILGAMGTANALEVLEIFAKQDPLRINEDDKFNYSDASSGNSFSFDWVMPLQELAKEEMKKIKTN